MSVTTTCVWDAGCLFGQIKSITHTCVTGPTVAGCAISIIARRTGLNLASILLNMNQLVNFHQTQMELVTLIWCLVNTAECFLTMRQSWRNINPAVIMIQSLYLLIKLAKIAGKHLKKCARKNSMWRNTGLKVNTYVCLVKGYADTVSHGLWIRKHWHSIRYRWQLPRNVKSVVKLYRCSVRRIFMLKNTEKMWKQKYIMWKVDFVKNQVWQAIVHWLANTVSRSLELLNYITIIRLILELYPVK